MVFNACTYMYIRKCFSYKAHTHTATNLLMRGVL